MIDFAYFDSDTGLWVIISVDIQTILDYLKPLIDDCIESTKELIDSLDDFLKSVSFIRDLPRYPMVRRYSKCKTPDKNLIWKPRVKARDKL